MRPLASRLVCGLLAVICLAGGAAPTPTRAADEAIDPRRKVALVLGIGGYRKATSLPNPIEDARLVGERLKAAGFELHQGYDSTAPELAQAIDTFLGAAQGADIALVYYSGHALQIRAENYLMPVDYAPAPGEPTAGLVPVSRLLERMAGAAKARVLLLDACRDNPFADALATFVGKEAAGRGLAPINLPAADGTAMPDGTHGLVIGYATQPNQTASDGDRRNGPYATALAAALQAPDADLHAILLQTAFAVVNETRGGQHPEHRVALTQPLHLVARKAPLQCDVLAGDEDNNTGVKAVPFDEIVAKPALEACTADLAANPANPRLMHNHARVLDKIGRDAEAVALYRKAAELGFPPSQNGLAVMLMNGEGVDRDFEAALVWLARAAAQGYRQSIANYTADMGKLFTGRSDRTAILQRGLSRAGHRDVTATGKLDEATLTALERLKTERGHKGALISLQTIHELGVAGELVRR